jgi:hypothetical protein
LPIIPTNIARRIVRHIDHKGLSGVFGKPMIEVLEGVIALIAAVVGS